MNGNWSQLDMTNRPGRVGHQASLALAVFWAMVTVGRVLFAAIGRWLPPGRPTTSCRSSWSEPSC